MQIYTKEKKININTSYAGTSQLNSQILLTGKGDVYVVSDEEELKPLQDKGLTAWEESLVYHIRFWQYLRETLLVLRN